MFLRLAHVCLYVKDLKRSLEFYSRFGFRTVFRFTRKGREFGAYLEIAPNQYIEIFEDPAFQQAANPSIAHFCLEAADIDLLIAELAARGIEHTTKKLGCDNTWQIWLSDPDGHAFEVHQYTPQSTQKLGGTIEADW